MRSFNQALTLLFTLLFFLVGCNNAPPPTEKTGVQEVACLSAPAVSCAITDAQAVFQTMDPLGSFEGFALTGDGKFADIVSSMTGTIYRVDLKFGTSTKFAQLPMDPPWTFCDPNLPFPVLTGPVRRLPKTGDLIVGVGACGEKRGVYRVDGQTGDVKQIAKFAPTVLPNGIVFIPNLRDELLLHGDHGSFYVVDSGAPTLWTGSIDIPTGLVPAAQSAGEYPDLTYIPNTNSWPGANGLQVLDQTHLIASNPSNNLSIVTLDLAEKSSTVRYNLANVGWDDFAVIRTLPMKGGWFLPSFGDPWLIGTTDPFNVLDFVGPGAAEQVVLDASSPTLVGPTSIAIKPFSNEVYWANGKFAFFPFLPQDRQAGLYKGKLTCSLK